MPQNDTLIFRVELEHDRSIYRDIEIEASKSLHKLAEAVVEAFGFDFDHAFGFYSGIKPTNMYNKNPRYELFADMGNADPGVLGVTKTKVGHAFPAAGHRMMFLFDYGDEWLFQVTFKEPGSKTAKTKYPRVVGFHGDAPPQYPDEDDCENEGPISGYNPATGQKIVFGK